MGIQISSGKTKPALVFDKFFLERLTLSQDKADQDEGYDKYALDVVYRLYAVDDEGKRHYEIKTSSFRLDDYIAEALRKANYGDIDLLQAMAAIEAALAKIIEDQTDLGAATVVQQGS